VIRAGLLLLLAVSPVAPAEDLERLVTEHPDRVTSLLERLDLERGDLEAVRAAWRSGDLVAACQALLRHYEASPWRTRLDVAAKDGDRALAEADDVLRDTFTLQNLRGVNPRLDNGRVDWWSRGPKDDREWTVVLNWHLYFGALREAYRTTGDARYARAFGDLVTDWILSNPPPTGKPRTQPWRSLEAAMRLTESWPHAFFGFLRSPDVPASAKILMLSSVPEQADVCRRHHTHRGNHVLTEMLALVRAATYWPEFRDAPAWIDYAFATAAGEMERQVYPDGAQKELSNHYQVITARSFDRLATAAREAGRPLPAAYEERLAAMWSYLGRVAKPSGDGPLNNDADGERNAHEVLDAAGRWGRDDWRFLATAGEEGTRPPGTASIHFPWAGQVVMRSGYGRDALWSWFDVGPSGQAHSHYDRLHLSVSALGRDFLVDTGRYHYKRDEIRKYFVGPRGHNVVIVNGRRPPLNPRLRAAPGDDGVLLAPDLDFARGRVEFDGPGPRLSHERAVLRFRDDYLLVVDLVVGFGLHDVEALWHFHPDVGVVLDGTTTTTSDVERANLRLIPIGEMRWNASLVTGREAPDAQGWWSASYNERVPATAAVYRARHRGPALFGWLIAPHAAGERPPSVERLPADPGTLHVRVRGDGEQEIAVRMRGSGPLPVPGNIVDGDLAVLDDGRLVDTATADSRRGD
jgi:hypothetical protein